MIYKSFNPINQGSDKISETNVIKTNQRSTARLF
jgi:hypothetical protein